LWGPIIPPAKDLVQRLWVGSAKGRIWHSTYYTVPHLSWDGPIVITVVDMNYETFPEYIYNATKFIERKRNCIEQADKVIAISESTKRDILEYFRIPESKVTVTRLAASTFFKELHEAHKNKFREQFGLGKPFILYVGPRESYKNFHTLLKAYSLWKRRSDFDLICVGGASQWSEDEIEVITQAKLGNSVKLFASTGDEELRAFYSSAYAFVYPSIYEGFGIPPLEAMGCGTPVIVSNTSSIPEVVGDAGLYFEPSSEEELLDALDKIMDDASLYKELVRRGLERSKIFSWGKTTKETYNIYREIL